MTWPSLVATLLGAVIALSSALLVERRRERKEERIERHRIKREVYVRYLAAHADARTELRVLSVSADVPDEERHHRAFTAYAACYAARYELAILAPESVLASTREFDRCARELRDLVIDGTNMRAPAGGLPRMQRYLEAMKAAQSAMRVDLGVDPSV
ncbi:hypothetical protein [Kitasatospora sp. NPDC056184]|uniref:hypothetical protein n=1 Tax=Kitasatospora sp. NPDC056184 TaxID=3345738 RepID=UPI0035D61A90